MVMIIKSTTALRTELGEITRICKEKSEPVYLTKNGEGELVIMSIAAFERREASSICGLSFWRLNSSVLPARRPIQQMM